MLNTSGKIYNRKSLLLRLIQSLQLALTPKSLTLNTLNLKRLTTLITSLLHKLMSIKLTKFQLRTHPHQKLKLF
jgi:hypothetical protein